MIDHGWLSTVAKKREVEGRGWYTESGMVRRSLGESREESPNTAGYGGG